MSSAVKYQRTLFEPEHELFRESYRAFLERHVAPYHDEWEKAAPGLKSLDDALEIRRRMLMAFEIAEKTQDHLEIFESCN